MRIDELLRQAREMKASDLHVSVGIPPKCRVNGELVALPCGIIMPLSLIHISEPTRP